MSWKEFLNEKNPSRNGISGKHVATISSCMIQTYGNNKMLRVSLEFDGKTYYPETMFLTNGKTDGKGASILRGILNILDVEGTEKRTKSPKENEIEGVVGREIGVVLKRADAYRKKAIDGYTKESLEQGDNPQNKVWIPDYSRDLTMNIQIMAVYDAETGKSEYEKMRFIEEPKAINANFSDIVDGEPEKKLTDEEMDEFIRASLARKGVINEDMYVKYTSQVIDDNQQETEETTTNDDFGF